MVPSVSCCMKEVKLSLNELGIGKPAFPSLPPASWVLILPTSKEWKAESTYLRESLTSAGIGLGKESF